MNLLKCTIKFILRNWVQNNLEQNNLEQCHGCHGGHEVLSLDRKGGLCMNAEILQDFRAGKGKGEIRTYFLHLPPNLLTTTPSKAQQIHIVIINFNSIYKPIAESLFLSIHNSDHFSDQFNYLQQTPEEILMRECFCYCC